MRGESIFLNEGRNSNIERVYGANTNITKKNKVINQVPFHQNLIVYFHIGLSKVPSPSSISAANCNSSSSLVGSASAVERAAARISSFAGTGRLLSPRTGATSSRRPLSILGLLCVLSIPFLTDNADKRIVCSPVLFFGSRSSLPSGRSLGSTSSCERSSYTRGALGFLGASGLDILTFFLVELK